MTTLKAITRDNAVLSRAAENAAVKIVSSACLPSTAFADKQATYEPNNVAGRVYYVDLEL